MIPFPFGKSPYFFIIIISGILLYLIILPLLRRMLSSPQVKDVFQVNSEPDYIYIHSYCKTETMGRGVIASYYRNRFEKIKIKTGEVLYTIKFPGYSSRDYNEFKLLCIDRTFACITDYENRLYIVNTKTGKILANHKSILKSNPELKGIVTVNSSYDFNGEGLIFYDNQGYGYYIKLDTLLISKAENKPKTKNKNRTYKKITDSYNNETGITDCKLKTFIKLIKQ